MPHLREGKVPKYRLHRNSRQAVVTLDGRDFYLGPWRSTASRVEYDRLIGEWLANGRRLPAPANEAADLTIVEIADRYLQFATDYYVKDGRPTDTIYGIRRALTYLCEFYGEQTATSFGPLSLLAIQKKMIANQKSRRYINDTTDRIRRIFKWAAARELVQIAVYQALQTVPGLRKGRTDAKEPVPVGPVRDEVVVATLPFMPPIIRAMVQFQRLTGCRPDEVCQLRPESLDREGRVWSYRPAHHKTEHLGRERVIFVGPQAQAVITPYLDGPADAPCFSPTQSEKARNRVRKMGRVSPLTPSQQRREPKPNRTRRPGARYTTDSYRRAIHRAADKADAAAKKAQADATPQARLIPRWSPNRLRHTAATEIRRQFGVEASQVVLGHSRLDVTEIYAERDLTRAAEIMLDIG